MSFLQFKSWNCGYRCLSASFTVFFLFIFLYFFLPNFFLKAISCQDDIQSIRRPWFETNYCWKDLFKIYNLVFADSSFIQFFVFFLYQFFSQSSLSLLFVKNSKENRHGNSDIYWHCFNCQHRKLKYTFGSITLNGQ